MAYHVTYKDKNDGQKKTLRRIDRYSAEADAVRLREEGHAEVEVRDAGMRTRTAAGGNAVASVLSWAGFVLIAAGIVVGIVAATDAGDWRAAWTIWLTAVVTGLLLVGLAEVIGLLDRINRKLDGERAGGGMRHPDDRGQ